MEHHWAFFGGEFAPLEQATVRIDTHALNYGTGCFEGIRAYWNPAESQLYALKLLEHFRRMASSSRILNIDLGYTPEALSEITLELLRRNDFHQDVYVRPLAYKSAHSIKLGLSGHESRLAIYCKPMGEYLDTAKGLSVAVSSWRRLDDMTLPARSKATGAYLNAALASDEAVSNGFDEALMLTLAGNVSEAASANLFLVRDGELVTPPLSEDILEGITRGAVMEIAGRELGRRVVERAIDRSELYVADEIFLCGTGVQIAPVTSVDRRTIGDGSPGALTTALQKLYFEAVRGRLPQYRSWLRPVYGTTPLTAPFSRPAKETSAKAESRG
jgi:branched-chain amino acid aminotransferase